MKIFKTFFVLVSMMNGCGRESGSNLETEIKPEENEIALMDIKLTVLAPKDARVFKRDFYDVPKFMSPGRAELMTEENFPAGGSQVYDIKVPYGSNLDFEQRHCTSKSLLVKESKEMTVQLQRLDLHPLKINRPDGSSYFVDGSWEIEVFFGDDDCTIGTVNSSTGLDVWPGKYRLSFEGEDRDGREYRKVVAIELN